MYKGDLSRQPALICCLDYRLLFEIHENAFSRWFPGTLLHRVTQRPLKLKTEARDWVFRNWDVYFCVFAIGAKFLEKQIIRKTKFIPEFYGFDDHESFRIWVSLNVERLFRIYTNDKVLLGLDELIQEHSGWTEEIGTHGLRERSTYEGYTRRLHQRGNRRPI